MLQTEHYQLNQWDFEDPILMADFNHDNQTIDAALHGLAGQAAEKADASAVSSLAAQVSQKAEQTALAAEEAARINGDKAEKAAREAAVAALDKRAGAQLIRVETLTENNAYFHLSLRDINWADWREVHLLFQPESYSGTCNLQFNGASSTTLGNSLGSRWHVILYPCFTPKLSTGGFFHPSTKETPAFSFGLPFQDLDHLQIGANAGVFSAGAAVTIWGVK